MNTRIVLGIVAALVIGAIGGMLTVVYMEKSGHEPDAAQNPLTETNGLVVSEQGSVSATPSEPESPVAAAVAPAQQIQAPAANPAADTAPNSSRTLSRADLLALADNKYADGNLPLGDYKYVTDAPKKGYIYLCNVHKDNPGSMVLGTWVNGDTWNFLKKVAVSGSITWPNAVFSNVLSAGLRVLSGNGLPTSHTTGTFPVQLSDPAYKFDSNPNAISAQSLKASVPADPVYSNTPYCMGGEVGIMLTGVPLFNGFDAGLRDAAAHELQDSCDGHPQGTGEYHYHSLSSCFKDTDVSTVLGYAYDGFPITGPKVADGKYLTTEDLDVCHGVTSEVTIDGQKKTTYHYVMTRDFPYSAGCFRGKPVTTGPSAGQPSSQGSQQSPSGMQSGQGGQGQPPQEAVNACTGKQDGSSCSFTTARGDQVSGVCHTPPNGSLACVPNR